MEYFNSLLKKVLLFSALLAFNNAFSQTGPGGVGTTATMPMWLDASSLNLASNAAVSSWSDRSGNGNNAVQNTSTWRPRYIINALNGRPLLRFDGANDFLQTGAISGLNTNTQSIIMVAKNNNNNTGFFYRAAYTSGAGSNSNQMIGTYYQPSSNNIITHTRDAAGNFRSATLGSGGQYAIMETVWNVTTLTSYRNGSVSGTISGANAIPTGHTMSRIGANSAGQNYFLGGDIAEVIVYSTAINTTQRTLIDNYLSSKYNLSVSLDRYAFDGTHPNDVAGIGQESATDFHNDSRGSGIVRINTPSALTTGDYLLWGHDNGALTASTTEMPTEFSERITREWRADETGDVGTVTVIFDLTGLTLNPSTGTYYLLTDADGDFSDASVSTSAGTYNAGTNTLTFTGIDLADGIFFTIGNSPNIFSVQTGNWNTASTWNCNCIPTSTNTVEVRNSHVVTVDAAANTGNFTIRNGGTLAFSGVTTLNLSGSFTNQGTFTAGTGTLNFIGTSAQSITASTTTTFNNLTANNSAGVTLTSGTFQLGGALTVSAGTFTNSGTFTLLSNVTSTARIAPVAPGASIAGTFIIQRFISSRTANWGDLASPVQSTTLLDWDNELFMSGVGGADGNAGDFKSVYMYDEPTVTYIPITSTGTTLTPGRGYEIWLATNSSTLNATTITTVGTPTFGDRVIPISRTTGNSDPGWNLVGNPFASAIDWSSLTKNDLDGSFYVYDAGTSSYTARTGGDIPHTQGFYVFANSTSSTLTIPESAKSISNASTFHKLVSPATFRMKIQGAALPFSHTAELSFDAAATSGYESGLDARYLKSPEKKTPEIYMHTDNGTRIMKNVLNPSAETVEVPLTVKIGQSGVHTIDTEGIENLQSEYSCVILKDNELGKTIDLAANPAYSFEANEGVIENRFVIHLTKEAAGCEQALATNESSVLTGDVDVLNTSEGVFVQFNLEETTDATISVVNVLGQEIMNKMNTRAGKQLVRIDVPSGVNGIHFITVTVNGKQFTNKIYLDRR
jgi:hypothetical protein